MPTRASALFAARANVVKANAKDETSGRRRGVGPRAVAASARNRR